MGIKWYINRRAAFLPAIACKIIRSAEVGDTHVAGGLMGAPRIDAFRLSPMDSKSGWYIDRSTLTEISPCPLLLLIAGVHDV